MPDRTVALPGVAGTQVRVRLAALARVDPLTVLPFAMALAAAAALAMTSIARHDRFGSNAYDLGIYDQSLWGLSHFHLDIPNTVQRMPTLLVELPLMFTLAPLYWLWDDARMLLVAQALLLALASLPIFWWARRELGSPAALLFQGAYLAFFGVLSGNLYDFHPAAVAAPLISFALFGLVTGRTRLLLVMIALLLLTKENYALTVIAFGLYVAVAQRRWRLGLPIVAVAAAWFALVFKVVLPAMSGRSYAAWFYGELGSGPGSALIHLVRHPIDSVQIFFSPHAKRLGLFNLFAPWLFLPVLSPLLLVGLPTLAERFFGDKPAYWAQGFHYTLPLAPVLAFAAIDATRRLSRLTPEHRRFEFVAAAGIGILLAGLYFSFVRLRPLDELDRYATDRQRAGIHSCLATIPSDASVTATSALVPHLSHRRRIYLLDRRPLPRTDYLAIDLATWHYPLSASEIGRVVKRARAQGFGVRCSTTTTAVLQRGLGRGRLAPELASRLAVAAP